MATTTAGRIHVEIVTPSRRVLSQTVDEVRAPGAEGGFGVRPGHTPFVSVLKAGALEFVTGDSVELFAIGEGFAQVAQDQVLILTEAAERAEEIDLAAAQAQASELHKKLLGLRPGADDYEAHRALVERAAARVLVAERRR